MGPAEIERLRRVAYGPGSSAMERAGAAAALRALSGPDRTHVDSRDIGYPPPTVRDQPDGEVPERATTGEPDTQYLHTRYPDTRYPDTQYPDTQDAEAPLWRRSVHIAWLIPIVTASLVVGALGALDATGRLFPAETPTPSAGAGHPGDLAAADSWFDRPFDAAKDSFPFLETVVAQGISPSDLRLAFSDGRSWRVWVGRAANKLCLFGSFGFVETAFGTCVDRDRFAAEGIQLNIAGSHAQWLGGEVSSDSSSSDIERQAPQPSIPGSGPGDVDAANSWFEAPANPGDAFPDKELMDSMGVDQSDIRLVGPVGLDDDVLWVVKQGTTGFCLATVSDNEHTSQNACATLEEFRTSGLTISTPAFAAFWGGGGVEVTN